MQVLRAHFTHSRVLLLASLAVSPSVACTIQFMATCIRNTRNTQMFVVSFKRKLLKWMCADNTTHCLLLALSIKYGHWTKQTIYIDFNKTSFVAFIASKLEIITFCWLSVSFCNIQSFDGNDGNALHDHLDLRSFPFEQCETGERKRSRHTNKHSYAIISN